jgi:hypothetical protein
MLRCLKSIRSDPKPFVNALIKSYKGISLHFFAFSTFPAVYEFFTSEESIEYAVDFLLKMIEMKAPKDLVESLFQSMLFALWPFVDALWTNMHSGFAAKTEKNCDDVEIMMGFQAAIETCAPLVPPRIGQLIRDMVAWEPEMCASAVWRCLKITFDLWYHHCPEGMSFGCGIPFSTFLDESGAFELGHSISIVNQLVQNKAEVLAYPFNCELCVMACESIVFSQCDFAVFRKAFDGAEERPALFRAIEVDEPLTRLAPYCLDFFPSPDRKPNRRLLFPLKTRADPLFDPSLFIEVHCDNAAVRQAITEDQQKLLELEECFRMKVILDHSHRFSESLVRYRNAVFGRCCANDLRGQRIHPKEMADVAQQFLKHPRKDSSLVAAILPELLRVAVLPELPPSLKERFWKIHQAYHQVAWQELHPTKEFTHISRLVPAATQRVLNNFGNVFRLFSYLFGEVDIIRRKHCSSPDNFAKFVKFVSLASQYQNIIHVFLLFDKLVYQNKFFTSALDERIVGAWSVFTQMMWSLVTEDKELVTIVHQFSAAEM